MAKYQKYAEYKDSGVEWLGKVPEHWEVKKIKYLGSILNGYAFPSDSFTDEGIKVLKISNIQTMYLDWSDLSFVSEEQANKLVQFLVKKGDLVFALTRPIISTGIKATLMDLEEKILLNQRNAILRPNNLCVQKWLYYMILNQNFVQEFNNQIDKTGQQPNISTVSIGNLAAFVAPIEEQLKIVDFLDHETAKIDTLIAKQEKLIALLKEKRQAVISHAVTKGLNPNVPVKDSGVEWLGEVPEHWETPKMLYITTRIGDGLHSTPIYQDGTGYYFINGNNLVDGEIVITDTAKEVPESEFIKHQVTLDKSTVLLSINGTIGKVALYNNESVILGKSAAYINCHSELLPSYLASYLTTSEARNYYDLEVTGTTIFNLSLSSIRNMRVPLPSINEQAEIVQFITKQYLRYESLIQSADKQNKLLKERRTALISAAVTGKIDVRDWQNNNQNNMELSA